MISKEFGDEEEIKWFDSPPWIGVAKKQKEISENILKSISLLREAVEKCHERIERLENQDAKNKD